MQQWLIYGATGYTGELIATRAAAQGSRPILAGRNEATLRALAERLNCPYRVVGLGDADQLDAALEGVNVVLHCAGPFSRTAAPMVDACLRTRTHYLDITGEIAVLEALAARDEAAQRAGVMILPGVGFDTVPTDCLAVYLAQRLEDATHLTLAFAGTKTWSHGTTLTSLENAGQGAVRRGGTLESVPAAWKTRDIEFGGATRTCVTIPWGDLTTAFHSTRIPNIEVYLAASAHLRRQLRMSRYVGALLRTWPLQSALASLVPQGGPDEAARTNGQCYIWGRVENASGKAVEAQLRTPDAYHLTMLTALLIVGRVIRGDAPVGFQTPAKAYGPDLILEVEGTVRH